MRNLVPMRERDMAIEIIPTGAALGAEIRGVDLSVPFEAEDFASVENAFNEYGVVFFRQQKLTPAQQLDFTHNLCAASMPSISKEGSASA